MKRPKHIKLKVIGVGKINPDRCNHQRGNEFVLNPVFLGSEIYGHNKPMIAPRAFGFICDRCDKTFSREEGLALLQNNPTIPNSYFGYT